MSQCGSLKQNSAFNNLPPSIEVLTVFFPAFNDSIGIKVSLHKGYWKTGFITSNIGQLEEIIPIRKTTSDVHCTSRPLKTRRF